MFDKVPFVRNPPDEIVVKARLNASKSLMSDNVYKKITKMVVKE